VPESQLTMILSAPVIERGDGVLRLDNKFVEGMRLHKQQWGGPVHCVMWKGATSIPFGADYTASSLDFSLELLEPGQEPGPQQVAGAAVVAAAADLSQTLGLAPICHAAGVQLVYTVEYTLKTRLQILALDRNRSALRKARSFLWHITDERRRRKAFREADGVQFNGYPAQNAYAAMVKDGLLFLDGRVRLDMMATSAEMTARAARLASGAPLRIVHSGRLVTMKGAQDLLPVARALKMSGADFQLDIFGAGEIEAEIRTGIQGSDLADCVRLHAPIDFETELVPYFKAHADVFLSCHRQADPSCTYLESFGCGLPVIGYDNEMWQAMNKASAAGWIVPMGDVKAIAAKLLDLSKDPATVSAHAATALEFAKAHDFESEFGLRMAHLAKHAGK
jgi:colanic acid/amylovoran biosynthesis glycosyltransferase